MLDFLLLRVPHFPSPLAALPPLSPPTTQHWVFWLGPYLGATCAAICYTYLFQHELFRAKTVAASASAAPASGGAAPSAELKAQPAPVAVQSVVPAGQEVMQTPAEQTWPPAQALPQAPQLALSV